jgi:hypothetical protein
VLQLKDLLVQVVGEKVTQRDKNILEEMEGARRGRAWFAGHGGAVPIQGPHYSILVQYVKDYYKWFVCWEIARRHASSRSKTSEREEAHSGPAPQQRIERKDFRRDCDRQRKKSYLEFGSWWKFLRGDGEGNGNN